MYYLYHTSTDTGIHIITDIPLPRINKLTILGTLEFNQGPFNFTLEVQNIIIEGSMIIGTRGDPYRGNVDIVMLTGNGDTDRTKTIGIYSIS